MPMFALFRRILPENFWIRRLYSFGNALFAAVFFGFPARNFFCIGVTGTDGKTTTTEMIAHLLRAQGKRVFSLSSAKIQRGEQILTADKRTTPRPWNLQKWLFDAKKHDIEIVVLEVSSHALSQKRIFGVTFDIAVLTNITPEHLDYHGTILEYAKSKRLLFTQYLRPGGLAVLNIDDDFGALWAKELSRVQTFSGKDPNADFFGEDPLLSRKGLSFSWKEQKIFLPVFGIFNMANASAAFLATRSFGFSPSALLSAFASFSGVSGRMERVLEKQFSVFLDFALTPGALSEMLLSARHIGKRVLVVFGSPGTHPDPSVRGEMGKKAALLADIVCITDDEPYFADPQPIREEILQGAREALSAEDFAQKIFEEGDRRAAFRLVFQKALPGDVVILAGMGHLQSRNIQKKEIPWSDRKVAEEVFSELFPEE